MITLKEITTKKELTQFVKFPFKLYKNNSYWVPPIIKDEVDSFDKTENPVFEHADAKFFLAYQNNKIVGRIAAIINSFEVKDQNIKKMRFGWMDMIDDIEVSKALLSKVEEIGKQNKLEFIEGPVGFSNLDKVGVLTDGFEERGTMITWYNHPYYKEHLEKLGYSKEKKYTESSFLMKDVDITKYKRLAGIVCKRYDLKPLNFTSSKKIMPYVDEMFELFSESYSKLSSFVPISKRQITYFKEKFIGLIDPEFIKFVVDKDGKLVSFSITLPSFSKALQKSKGKLFPFGFIHFLKAKKHPKESVFYLIGIKSEYQNKGVIAIIFDEFYKTSIEKGIITNRRTPELENNKAIQLLWKNFNSKIIKRRSTYRKEII